MRYLCAVCTLTIIFTIDISSRADETSRLPTTGVNSIEGLNEVYNRLVRNAPSEKLREIRTGDDIGIALQAAWEEVRRETRIPHTPEDDYETWCRIDRSSTERFLAFVEGRLTVRVPEWWEALMRRSLASAAADGNVALTVTPGKRDPFYMNKAVIGADETNLIWMPDRIRSISRDHENLTISIGGDDLVVSPVLSKIWGLNAMCVGQHRWIVAMHSAGHPGYPLLYVDAVTQNEVWRADVWGEFPIFKSGGGFFHWVDFRVHNDSILVFGALNNSFYVEGFTIAEGTNLFRFSTSYCVQVDREKQASR